MTKLPPELTAISKEEDYTGNATLVLATYNKDEDGHGMDRLITILLPARPFPSQPEIVMNVKSTMTIPEAEDLLKALSYALLLHRAI